MKAADYFTNVWSRMSDGQLTPFTKVTISPSLYYSLKKEYAEVNVDISHLFNIDYNLPRWDVGTFVWDVPVDEDIEDVQFD